MLKDSAQAHGATLNGKKAGSLGHAACFSFYPGKNLGAYGDAGAVVSNDLEFIAKVRQIANHGGGANKYDNVVLGTNCGTASRHLSRPRCCAKLPHLPQWMDERRERAVLYSKLLDGVPGLVTPKEGPGAKSAWHLYTVRTPRRQGLIEELKKHGVSTAVHYPRPIHLQPAMGPAGGQVGDLPLSEGLSREVMFASPYPELPLSEVERTPDCRASLPRPEPRPVVFLHLIGVGLHENWSRFCCGYWGKNIARKNNRPPLGPAWARCATPVPKSPPRVPKLYPGTVATKSLADLLRSTEIDAIAIASPAALHAATAKAALLADKDVFVERDDFL